MTPCYKFKAKNPVRSREIGCPVIISPGDTVEVLGWVCQDGPTVYLIDGKKDCVPFSWLVEAGGNEAEMKRKMVMM